jgi:hypothetical protein
VFFFGCFFYDDDADNDDDDGDAGAEEDDEQKQLVMSRPNYFHHSNLSSTGRILTVETVPFKAGETDVVEEKLNTENTLWSEQGKNSRVFIFGVRIFYVVGQPAFEKVG